MTTAAYVDEARDKALQLILWETRFPGDAGPALKRVALRLGVAPAKLVALKYRQPKDIGVGIYAAIVSGYEIARDAQADRFTADHARTKPKTPLGRHLHRLAARLAGEDVQALKDDTAAEVRS